jgi:hypothetical protein
MDRLIERARSGQSGAGAAQLAELLGDLPVARVARVAGVHRDTLRSQLRGRATGRGATVEAVRGAVDRLTGNVRKSQ